VQIPRIRRGGNNNIKNLHKRVTGHSRQPKDSEIGLFRGSGKEIKLSPPFQGGVAGVLDN
jgi:hypothetical protein